VQDVITTLDMFVADRNAEYLGVSRLVLMENAGAAVARVVRERFPNVENVLVVAGTGDNGGDGLVAARHLHGFGKRVRVVLLGTERDVKEGPARINLRALVNLWGVELIEAPTPEKLLACEELFLKWAHVIIDAVLGTGIRGKLREPHSTAIDLMNLSPAPKVSVDVPSGMNPDTGDVPDKAVRANVTVTMHKPKRGFLNPNASKYLGEVVVAPIGIPPEAELVVGPGDLAYLRLERPPNSKKGDNGRILIVAGSREFSGAAALAALSALRAGSDLAVVLAPSPAAMALKSMGPDIIAVPLPGDYLNLQHLDTILEYADRSDVVVLGPGIGRRGETEELVRVLVDRIRKPMVIDADAIKALAGARIGRYDVVLTPHAGEFRILTGMEVPEGLTSRIEVVKRGADSVGAIVLLKGRYDIISDGKRVKVNKTGNPAMTVGGTGDVLTGLVASLMTKSSDVLEAAAVAAFINGIAGDLALRDLGGYHLLASDLLNYIPKAFAEAKKYLL